MLDLTHSDAAPSGTMGLGSGAALARTPEPAQSPAVALLARLIDQGVVLAEEWDELSPGVRAEIGGMDRTDLMLAKLVERHLLTHFQADTVRKGRAADLVIGHYRLLDSVGRGGMGVVYRAEHLHLRRQVAVKVMAQAVENNPRLLHRFYLEARAVARLQHPNIVSCLDAGRHQPPDGGSAREYYVMELVPGQDLLSHVAEKGPIPVHQSAVLFRQVAEALAEAHRHGLIHRDIKPSNVIVTPDVQAKLLDFGLALHPRPQMTEPGTLLGTVGYMAPEQARDPHGVDPRADLFSLGAALFLALTGKEPFPETGAALSDLNRRLNAPPPRVRAVRPELPVELDDLVARLMDADPDARYPSASAVAAALAPFTRWRPAPTKDSAPGTPARQKVLIADDDPGIRALIRVLLEDEFAVAEAADGQTAWQLIEQQPFDLVVADMAMPCLDGAGLIDRIRKDAPDPGMMVLLVSGAVPTETLGGLLLNGADDFIQKPFAAPEFRSRVRGLLNRRRGAQVRAARQEKAPETVRISMAAVTTRPTPGTAVGQPDARGTRTDDLSALFAPEPAAGAAGGSSDSATPEALALAVARLLEESNLVGRGYHVRLPRYVRALAGAVKTQGEYARLKDRAYVDMLEVVAPLHDLGLLVIPSNILMKPARLDAEEVMAVQTHTTVGSEVVVDVAARYAQALPCLTLAAEVVRHHHERWDGGGYPDLLGGAEIPLSARVVGLVSVYDAMRSRRPYRPALTHARAVRAITTECPGQFDPALVAAFALAAGQFDQIYQQHPR